MWIRRRHLWVTWACLATGLAGWVGVDTPAEAERALSAKGLRRVESSYTLPAEEDVKARLARLERLVRENQAALRRRVLRSVITAQSQSLLADLQAWQLALNAMSASTLFPPPLVPGPTGPQYPIGQPNAGLGELSELNRQEITGMFNLVAGVEADNAYEAAEALAREDDFDRGRASLRRAIERLDRAYQALKADPDVPAALGVLTRAENRPIRLGPLSDYRKTLERLEAGIASTRILTTAKGGTAPDYGVAANLVQGARLNLRLALGRLEEWERLAASKPSSVDPEGREALRREVTRRRDRFARSVALLRRAYDAYKPPPAIDVTTVVPIPEPREKGRIRALVEGHRAKLRAAFVAEAERALQTARVPLVQDKGASWVDVTVNGVPDLRMRVDPRASEVLVSERLAGLVGLSADRSSRRGSLRSIQLGPFTVREVPCRVVPDETISAPAILGAPVLGRFVVELEEGPEPSALTLTKVDVAPLAPQPRPSGAPPAKARR
ncbi:MAG: hypothetical protein AB7I30_23210 [Isosphaeraceae bacterium]